MLVHTHNNVPDPLLTTRQAQRVHIEDMVATILADCHRKSTVHTRYAWIYKLVGKDNHNTHFEPYRQAAHNSFSPNYSFPKFFSFLNAHIIL